MSSEDADKRTSPTRDDWEPDTLSDMLRLFYGPKMRPMATLAWTLGLAFVAVAVLSAIAFFRTDQIRCQIMYAALFVCGIQLLGMVKTFAWQMVHRNRTKAEILGLEQRLRELAEALSKQ